MESENARLFLLNPASLESLSDLSRLKCGYCVSDKVLLTLRLWFTWLPLHFLGGLKGQGWFPVTFYICVYTAYRKTYLANE